MLNLRQPPPEESSPSSSPAEDSRDAETVESVRTLLESRQPPGLARIRRFVLKPRPRLWKFGVGVWLWLVKIAEWFVDFLRWLGRGSGRVVKVLGLAGFIGRRVQNLGARVGHWGRNWSSAEGRLGRLGVRWAALGERLVKHGATFAAFSDGATELTKRAARFLAEVTDARMPDPIPDPAPDGGGPTPGPNPSPAPQRKAPATSAPDVARPESRSAPAPPAESRPRPAAKPAPASKAPAPEARSAQTRPPEAAPKARSGRTGPTGASPKPTPSPSPAAEPPPLPEDIPVYLQLRLRALRQSSRPLPESVQRLILEVTEARGWTRPGELAAWLGFDTNYLNRRYLAPMTKAGLVERRFPDRVSHPRQTYRAARATAPDGSPDR